MKWLNKLYVSPEIEKKKIKVKWKINHFAGVKGVYMIVLPRESSNQLEIIESSFFKQRYYRKRNMIIVGMAESEISAHEIVKQITNETYEMTGDADIKSYLLEKYEK